MTAADECSSAPIPTTASVGGDGMNGDPILAARGLTLSFGVIPALLNVDMELYLGEILAIVGESGSGKTSLLNGLSGQLRPQSGIVDFREPDGIVHDVHEMPASMLRTLQRSDWGFVQQDPRRGLRMNV